MCIHRISYPVIDTMFTPYTGTGSRPCTPINGHHRRRPGSVRERERVRGGENKYRH